MTNLNQRLRPYKPTSFGRYDLLLPLATGGMGEVFLARLDGSQGFEKLCVIKKIVPHLAQDPAFVERFVAEGRTLVKLSHGSIAQVLDMGLHEQAPYIALEFVDGKDLRRVAGRMHDRNLPVPLSFALYTMVRVLDALAYAHRKRGDDDKELGLVHRDISPQNVLVSYEGEVKIIDFGLAKSALSTTKTNPNIFLGKFLYMSPEQARHQRVDRRSDLYSVGLCLYELIARKNPFAEVPQQDLILSVQNPQVRPLHDVEPLCPQSLSNVVMKALSPDPAHRFQTAEEFRAKLQALLLEVDPMAGAETTSQFMREAFGVEYHAERRTLGQFKDVRATADEPDDAQRLKTREVEQSNPFATIDNTNPEGGRLSFEPTRRSTPDRAVVEEETRPKANMVGVEVAPSGRRRVLHTPLETPVEDDAPEEDYDHDRTNEQRALTVPESVHVTTDPILVPVRAKNLRAEKERAQQLERETTTTSGRRRGQPAKGKREEAIDTLVKTGSEPALTQRGTDQNAARTTDPGSRGTTRVNDMHRAPPKKSSLWVWLVLPIVAVVGVGGYIAWDLYSDAVKQRQLDAENRHGDTDVSEERRSREVPTSRPTAPKPAPAPVDEGDDLVAPNVRRVTPPSPKPTVVQPQTAGAIAADRLNNSWDRLNRQDASAASPFSNQVRLLTDKLEANPDDVVSIKAADALRTQIDTKRNELN